MHHLSCKHIALRKKNCPWFENECKGACGKNNLRARNQFQTMNSTQNKTYLQKKPTNQTGRKGLQKKFGCLALNDTRSCLKVLIKSYNSDLKCKPSSNDFFEHFKNFNKGHIVDSKNECDIIHMANTIDGNTDLNKPLIKR